MFWVDRIVDITNFGPVFDFKNQEKPKQKSGKTKQKRAYYRMDVLNLHIRILWRIREACFYDKVGGE